MAHDLYAALVADIAAPLTTWLIQSGVEPDLTLAPPTRADAGDLALPCHRYAKALRKPPQAIAEALAEVARAHEMVASAEPAAGFLNLRFAWPKVAERVVGWAGADEGALGRCDALAGQKVVVEYSSPNTNKPQHLGHCRNNILGETVSTLLKQVGASVTRVNLVNDRGVHICKSMVAYRRFGEGTTPEQAGKKGDHLVGDFYVRFEKAFQEEFKGRYPDPETRPDKDVYFNTESALGAEAREMLRAWEAGDPEVRALWKTMNGWCEAGFAATYGRMGIHFDRIDHESETYLLGKDLVEEGLGKGVFHKAANGAVVFDQARIGLEGEKAVLRADGTSVYTTQDLGTAVRRHEEHGFDRMVYVVGNEQDRHFQVLFGILGELRPELKGHLFHLSYGMVELPDGKMKSREGTVVDADDLMDELHEVALEKCQALWPECPAAELDERAEALALSGLKFFLLKFAPATTFIFDKEGSIKPEGETGVYCQYAYARASSILRKLGELPAVAPDWSALDQPQTREVLTALLRFPGEVKAAALEHKPSLLTKAIFELARAFAGFYNHPECRVMGAAPEVQVARAALVQAARRVLGGGLNLLGITTLEEM